MKTCPICEAKPAAEAFKPFCSQHCADLDLGRWLRGGYTISVPADPAEAEGLPTASGTEEDEN